MIMNTFLPKFLKKAVYLILIFVLGVNCKQNQEKKTIHLDAKEGLTLLMEGNTRFLENHPLHPDQTLERIRDLKKGQHPYAVVVSCSDSRVPPELVFDQGLGDLFVIRNAGNIIGDYELGSVEYAVEHLKAPLVIVLGHSQCGAIGAFIDHKNDAVPNHIQNIIDYIKLEPEEMELNESADNYYEMAIEANVRHGVHTLQSSEPVLAKRAEEGEVRIVGALFHLDTGRITILE
ncbi:carbonic anhydrase [Arenibacter sp. GZD96]|uniref:carbonic anhydrase n=1 Tax=Aurantibrevibacter litoralis TaxID=3106030 RepID=UPI002AFF7A74|nr:carbonic anhydrase [Arenibacter sp. GZD-96]MEA1786731.1 carbonic anhydrase [Arenibacter sp. GZD-96]